MVRLQKTSIGTIVWLYVITMGEPFRVSRVKSGATLKHTDASFDSLSEYVEECKAKEVGFFCITASEPSFKAIVKKMLSEGVIFPIPEEKERKRNRIYSWEYTKDQLWEWLKLDKERQVLADYLLNKQKKPRVTGVVGLTRVTDVADLTLEELRDGILAITVQEKELEKRRVLFESQEKHCYREKAISHLQKEHGLTKEQADKCLS